MIETQTVPKDILLFDETMDPKTGKKRHVYTLNGKPLYGVTTILSVISKGDALQYWAVRKALELLGRKHNKNLEGGYVPEVDRLPEAESFLEKLKVMTAKAFLTLLDRAYKAFKEDLESAGEFGTNVHKAVEFYVKDGAEPVDLTDIEMTAFNNFRQWYDQVGAKLYASELRVYSKDFWYAGTIDLVLEIDGKYWIGDVKTSGSIYPEHFFQTAAYERALRENGFDKEIVGHVIVNVRKNGKVDVKRSYGYTENLEAFLGALKIYKRKQALTRELSATQ